MELKGFDDAKGRSRPNSRNSNKSGGGGPGQPCQPLAETAAAAEIIGPVDGEKQPSDGFNFDQIMESVNFNSLLCGMTPDTNGGGSGNEWMAPAAAGGSRFSQFFQARPENNNNNSQSRRSSIQVSRQAFSRIYHCSDFLMYWAKSFFPKSLIIGKINTCVYRTFLLIQDKSFIV